MILVELVVPAMDENFDFMLDENALIEQVLGEIEEMLSKKLKQPLPENDSQFLLCSLDQNQILSRFHTLNEAGLKDGSKIMLI